MEPMNLALRFLSQCTFIILLVLLIQHFSLTMNKALTNHAPIKVKLLTQHMNETNLYALKEILVGTTRIKRGLLEEGSQ